MFRSALLSTIYAIVACIDCASAASAAESQCWSVHLVDDTAVVRATKSTEYKFVTATITSLQKTGTTKVVLRVLDSSDATDNTKSTYSVKMSEGVAEITGTRHLPYKVLVSLVDQLKNAGVAGFKFAVREESAGAPASLR